MKPREDMVKVQCPPLKTGRKVMNEFLDFVRDSRVHTGRALFQGQQYQNLCQKVNDTELLGQGRWGASAFYKKGLGSQSR